MQNFDCIGRLVKDPDVRVTKGGKAVVEFTLAVDPEYVKKGAEKKADFIRFIAFSSTANFLDKYGKKGRFVYIQRSQFKPNSWQDQEGNWHNSYTFVVERMRFLDKMQNDPEPPVAINNDAVEDFDTAGQNIFVNTPGLIPDDGKIPF